MNDDTAAPPTPRSNLFALLAVVLSGAAVLVCALVGIAYMAGWIGQPEHPAVVAVASGKAKSAEDAANLALAPGEVLVESATVTARAPEPMFPKYGAPVAPLPAPPESPATRPTGVPKSPYLPGPALKPAPSLSLKPPVVAPVDSPRPREQARDPRDEPRYAEEVRPPREDSRERRGGRRFCDNCAVVTAVSQYIDEWEVHLRFTDGSRRRLHYDRPPPVTRGDRVYFENGRLFLE